MQNNILEKHSELSKKISEEIMQNIGLVKPLSLTCYLSMMNGVEKISIAVIDETLPNDEIINLNKDCQPGNLFTCHIAMMDFYLHSNHQLYCSPYNSAKRTYTNENEGISFRLVDNLNDIKQIILNNTKDIQLPEMTHFCKRELRRVADDIAQRCFTDWIGPHDICVVAFLEIFKGKIFLDIDLVGVRDEVVASLNFRFEKTGKMNVDVKPEIDPPYIYGGSGMEFNIYDYADGIKNGVFEVLNYLGFFDKVICE